MDRKKRLAKIESILAREEVRAQEALRTRLKKAGLKVSQASLSRDLKALGAQRVRTPGGGWGWALPATPPVAPTEEAFRRRFGASVTGVRRSQAILLLFTPPGEAQLIGRLLDEAGQPGMLGTVAGDDTILVVAGNLKQAKALEKTFKEMTHENP